MRLAVDVIAFRKSSTGIDILLIQRKNEPYKDHWALPGGFVGENESLEKAACREFKEETSLSIHEVAQLGAFGEPDRDPRGRVVSVVYMVHLPFKESSDVKASSDAKNAEWFGLKNFPKLAFDHQLICQKAISSRFYKEIYRKD